MISSSKHENDQRRPESFASLEAGASVNPRRPQDVIESWLASRPVLTAEVDPVAAALSVEAFRALRAWLPLISGAFVLAGLLTYWIAFYDQQQTDDPVYVSYFAASSAAKPSATMYYEESEEQPSVKLVAPSSGTLIISDLASEDSCGDLHAAALDPSKGAPPLFVIDLRDARAVRGLATIQCTLARGAADETFSHRAISFVNGAPYGGPQTEGLSLQTIRLSMVELEGTEMLTLRGGRPDPGSPDSETIEGRGRVVARWRQVVHEERRDVILVIIGTMIALGAAMLIEALRPMIDARIRGRTSPSTHARGAQPEAAT